jgi:predicted DNA-binding transcriptional regulator YafY
MRVLLERFERPEGFDLTAHLAERGESPKNIRIRIRFARRVYRWARGGIPAKIEEETDDGSGIVVTFYFENMEYIASWLVRYGLQVTVLEPATLKKALKEKSLANVEANA